MNTDLYQTVTDKIIAALEAGALPWQFPWNREPGGATPANLSTGRAYRGINTLLLNLAAMSEGYCRYRWLTYQQARSLGAHVRRGETGTPIVFFKLLEVESARRSCTANHAPAAKIVPLLRSFTVFNADQVDNLPPALAAPISAPDWNPVEEAERLLAHSEAIIRHGGDQAFYRPSDDVIQLPARSAFPKAEGYYGVALHELTHWTAHSSRCNRPMQGRQHLTAYAFEELIAEMGAAFLCGHCGINAELQHAGYIGHWLQALRNDKRLVFTAASMAQKAADFVLSTAGATPYPQPAAMPCAA
jgi:antirestriction protein ArdC